jgi:hypothetical protein
MDSTTTKTCPVRCFDYLCPTIVRMRDRRHTFRDRRPCTTACPGCWATETHKLKYSAVRKKIFCTGLTRAAKARLESLVPPWQAQRTNSFVLFESPFTSVSTFTKGATHFLALRQDSSIPAHEWSNLFVLVTFHPLSKAKRRFYKCN